MKVSITAIEIKAIMTEKETMRVPNEYLRACVRSVSRHRKVRVSESAHNENKKMRDAMSVQEKMSVIVSV